MRCRIALTLSSLDSREEEQSTFLWVGGGRSGSFGWSGTAVLPLLLPSVHVSCLTEERQIRVDVLWPL